MDKRDLNNEESILDEIYNDKVSLDKIQFYHLYKLKIYLIRKTKIRFEENMLDKKRNIRYSLNISTSRHKIDDNDEGKFDGDGSFLYIYSY